MPAFDEVQFPSTISYGSRGGPAFLTEIVVVDSGHELRNIAWAASRAKYNIAYGIRTHVQMNDVHAFFYARQGRAYAFRYKDWLDYQATQAVLAQTGSKTVQLIKTYTSGSRSYVRTITKPVASPAVTLRRGGSPFASFTLDVTTGIVTLTADSSASITAITQANPGKVTTSGSHGFSNGDKIYIENVVGMTQVNGLVFTITVIDADEFTIGVNTTAYTAYSSAGNARKYVQPAEVLDWTGEFDVPVRFDSDHIPASLEDFDMGNVEEISLIEVRI